MTHISVYDLEHRLEEALGEVVKEIGKRKDNGANKTYTITNFLGKVGDYLARKGENKTFIDPFERFLIYLNEAEAKKRDDISMTDRELLLFSTQIDGMKVKGYSKMIPLILEEAMREAEKGHDFIDLENKAKHYARRIQDFGGEEYQSILKMVETKVQEIDKIGFPNQIVTFLREAELYAKEGDKRFIDLLKDAQATYKESARRGIGIDFSLRFKMLRERGYPKLINRLIKEAERKIKEGYEGGVPNECSSARYYAEEYKKDCRKDVKGILEQLKVIEIKGQTNEINNIFKNAEGRAKNLDRDYLERLGRFESFLRRSSLTHYGGRSKEEVLEEITQKSEYISKLYRQEYTKAKSSIIQKIAPPTEIIQSLERTIL